MTEDEVDDLLFRAAGKLQQFERDAPDAVSSLRRFVAERTDDTIEQAQLIDGMLGGDGNGETTG